MVEICKECDGKGWVVEQGPEYGLAFQTHCESCNGIGVITDNQDHIQYLEYLKRTVK